jgi:peptidoglycan hydrolase-like protein with peptidoglycan-binding domain
MLRLLRAAVLALLTIVSTVVTQSATTVAQAATVLPAPPSTPTGLPTGIEDFARYAGQNSCDLRSRPGTIALAQRLVGRFTDTSYATGYSCGTDGNRSEHYDGRAIDWMVSLRNATQAKEAASAINWFLGTDKAGNAAAIARRAGVMYLIWNNKIWGSYSRTWEPYLDCATAAKASTAYDSLCHRNHMHISLSYNGANGRTSLYSKQVFNRTDYGTCKADHMNWAATNRTFNPTRCVQYVAPSVPANASTVYRNVAKYSGATMGLGSRGPIVSALQAALHRPVTGYLDTATRDALVSFQKRWGMPVTGTSTVVVWRKLLTIYYPR